MFQVSRSLRTFSSLPKLKDSGRAIEARPNFLTDMVMDGSGNLYVVSSE